MPDHTPAGDDPREQPDLSKDDPDTSDLPTTPTTPTTPVTPVTPAIPAETRQFEQAEETEETEETERSVRSEEPAWGVPEPAGRADDTDADADAVTDGPADREDAEDAGPPPGPYSTTAPSPTAAPPPGPAQSTTFGDGVPPRQATLVDAAQAGDEPQAGPAAVRMRTVVTGLVLLVIAGAVLVNELTSVPVDGGAILLSLMVGGGLLLIIGARRA